METSERPAFCEQHGPYTARVVELMGRSLVTGGCAGCSKLREEREAERHRAEQDARKRVMIHTLAEPSRIPARFSQATLASPPGAPAGHQQVLTRGRWYLETWPERKAQGTGLVISGRPGTGKTHMVCAIGIELIQRGESVLFATVAEAMREIRETYNGSSKSEAQILRTYTQPTVLILDEVGSGPGSDHEKHQLFEIVNRRYADCKPTFLVSNLETTALLQYLGDRLMDRMREGGGKLFVFDWQSYRR